MSSCTENLGEWLGHHNAWSDVSWDATGAWNKHLMEKTEQDIKAAEAALRIDAAARHAREAQRGSGGDEIARIMNF